MEVASQDGYTVDIRDVQNYQQYLCLNNAQLVLRGPKNVAKKYPPPLQHQHHPELLIQGSEDGSMLSYCTSPYHPNVAAEIETQATFFQSSVVQFW